MSRTIEKGYGGGYVIVPLGKNFFSDNGVTQGLEKVSGVRKTTHEPHITLLDLGIVPAYKVSELQDAVTGCVRNFRDCELMVGGMSVVRPGLCLDVQQQTVARRMNTELQRSLVRVIRSPKEDYKAHVSVADIIGQASLNSYRDKVRPLFDELVARVDIEEVDILLKYPSKGLHQRIIRIPVS